MIIEFAATVPIAVLVVANLAKVTKLIVIRK